MARRSAASDDVAAWRELREWMAALASTGGETAALARSIENLLSGMLEGTVVDLARATELVAEAWARHCGREPPTGPRLAFRLLHGVVPTGVANPRGVCAERGCKWTMNA